MKVGIAGKELEYLKGRVNESIDFMNSIGDDEVRRKIEYEVSQFAKGRSMSLSQKLALAKGVYNAIRGLDILQPLVENDEINEIMVNGYNNIFIERRGKIARLNLGFESKERLEAVIQKIVGGVNRVVNEASPIVDARLQDGSRVNIVLAPLSIDGSVMTIRKFPKKALEIKDLLKIGAISLEAVDFLHKLIYARYNIFICGGTSSGKTTLLNALAGLIPEEERIITIEDSAELQIKGRQNIIRLETRNANSEGRGEISMDELIKTSLRMRPDRIIVGEVRGRECFSMLQAMNTGHDGSLSTGHANSPQDMISRLEAMVLMTSQMPIEAVRRQIVSALEIMVHTTRLRDGRRQIVEISELVAKGNGAIQFNKIFSHKQGELQYLGNKLEKIGKLEGYSNVEK
ncbi:MAG: CpaF family protein [Bacillota bacterium]